MGVSVISCDVPENHAGLLFIGRNDHNGAAFAGDEAAGPILEDGQIDRDQGQDDRFAAAPADDQPSLVKCARRRHGATGAGGVDVHRGRIYREAEQRRQEHGPRDPTRWVLEPAREQRGLAHRTQDGREFGSTFLWPLHCAGSS
jgi:hypothetical protein